MKIRQLSYVQTIALGFFSVIAAGTILLMLPAASQSGHSAGFVTALFTSVSASCVTGLVLVDTATFWTGFGQAVILLLIQTGGLGFMTIATLFSRLKAASEAGKKYTMILGNPEPETYIPLAQLINYFKVDCSKLHIFAMDEWADDQGNIAPETYEAGFAHSMLKYFVYQIDEKLRMPMENVHYPTNANIGHYSKLITEIGEGGADICSSSPGWTGHMAFIDPVDEFTNVQDMDEYLQQEARIVTLHPLRALGENDDPITVTLTDPDGITTDFKVTITEGAN